MEPDPFGPSRIRLMGLAYRMLGERTEAEDVLQDAWLRFSAMREVKDRDALLTTIVTRLCLDRLKSAHTRRLSYVGPWLPEPVTDAAELSPGSATELADDISFALLLALERLGPAERAAFLLHDVFDMPFAEIAAILGREEPACRQLAARARKAFRVQRRTPAVSADAHAELLSAFGAAVGSGDTAALVAMLRDDAILLADGGGMVAAAINPILGAERIARFLIGLAGKFARQAAGIDPQRTTINGMPGAIVWLGGHPDQVLAFDFDSGSRIAAIYIIRNPDKLTGLLPS